MENSNQLSEKKCTPCEGGTPPLKGRDIEPLIEELDNGWMVQDEHHLEKTFKFPNFKSALAFTNHVGEIAEEQGHHPDILLAWGKVKVTLWTHAINGLSENDFILAAKCDRAMEKGK